MTWPNRSFPLRGTALLLSIAVLAAPLQGLAEPARMGVITGDGVTMREGPGTTFDRLGRLAQGEWVTILEASSGWVKVLDSRGQVAWVFGRWVDEVPVAPDEPGSGLLSVTTVEEPPSGAPGDSIPAPPLLTEHRQHRIPWLWIGAGVVAAGVAGAVALSRDTDRSTGSLSFQVEFP